MDNIYNTLPPDSLYKRWDNLYHSEPPSMSAVRQGIDDERFRTMLQGLRNRYMNIRKPITIPENINYNPVLGDINRFQRSNDEKINW